MARAILLSATLLAALVCSASGQTFPTPEEAGLNYSITFGASLLVTSNLVRTAYPMVGFSYYDQAGENFGDNAMFGLTADWTMVERNDGKTVQLVPLLFNYRQYGFISSYRVFANLGVGIVAATDSITDMKLNSGVNFGWTGGLGFDVSNNLFIQARFIGGQDPGDDGLTSIQLGYRF